MRAQRCRASEPGQSLASSSLDPQTDHRVRRLPGNEGCAKPTMRPSAATAIRVRPSLTASSGSSRESGLASKFIRSPSLDNDDVEKHRATQSLSGDTASRIRNVTIEAPSLLHSFRHRAVAKHARPLAAPGKSGMPRIWFSWADLPSLELVVLRARRPYATSGPRSEPASSRRESPNYG